MMYVVLLVIYSVFSASLSIGISIGALILQTCHLAHLSICVYVCWSVCRSVQKVYCGKMAEWIRMPFGMVSGVCIRWGW